jgi:NADPH-dependent ferric siderophore reductase
VRNVAIFVVVGLSCLVGLTIGQPLDRALSRQREPSTELYFRRQAPAGARADVHGAMPVSFTIHNIDAPASAYAYTISVDDQPVLRGRTSQVPTSGRVDIDTSVPVPGGKEQVELSVRLANSQTIRTWVTRPGA